MTRQQTFSISMSDSLSKEKTQHVLAKHLTRTAPCTWNSLPPASDWVTSSPCLSDRLLETHPHFLSIWRVSFKCTVVRLNYHFAAPAPLPDWHKVAILLCVSVPVQQRPSYSDETWLGAKLDISHPLCQGPTLQEKGEGVFWGGVSLMTAKGWSQRLLAAGRSCKTG